MKQDWSWKPCAGDIPPKRKKRKTKRTKAEKRKRRELALDKLLHAPGRVFYRSRKWKSLRREVLKEYGWTCMKCGVHEPKPHVDHIIPRSWAPKKSLDFDNLQILCGPCNMEKMNYNADDYREKAATEKLDREALATLREIIA